MEGVSGATVWLECGETNLSSRESDADNAELVLAGKELVLDHASGDHCGGCVICSGFEYRCDKAQDIYSLRAQPDKVQSDVMALGTKICAESIVDICVRGVRWR